MSGLPWILLLLALAGVGAQTLRLERAEALREACAASIQTAAAQSQVQADAATTEALTTLEEKSHEDRPVVERVVSRVVRQCASASHLPVPAAAAGAGQARGPAQDDDAGAFAQDVADDLAACQAELNRLDVMRSWIKANGG